MGRRGKVMSPNRFEDGSRASIGDFYVEKACSTLNTACLKEANLFLPRFSIEQITPMLFRDEDVAKLKATHMLTAYSADSALYNVAPSMDLHLKFPLMPAPNCASCLEWQEERAVELRGALKAAEALVDKWTAAKWVLRWFNRNATAGAVRALWPSVLQLCPDSPAMRELTKTPARYTNPQGLTPLLPLVRATASTVASMALLPDGVEVRPHHGVRLAFKSREVEVEGVVISREEIGLHL